MTLSAVNMGWSQPMKQWDVHYDGPRMAQDFARSFVLDDLGNTYIVGSSDGNKTLKDIAVIKYDSLGAEIWTYRYNAPDSLSDWGYAIVIDRYRNLYIAGETATNSRGIDYIVIKLNEKGDEQWVKTYNGPSNGNDVAVDIALDPDGHVIVTGKSRGMQSLDDYLTIKYDDDGNEIWVNRYNGTRNSIDEARTIHVDNSGNVYVSGGSIGDTSDYDFVTIKYNSAGIQMWESRYNGPGNGYDLVFYQGSLVTDFQRNVYLCGYSTGTDGNYEYTLVKYDSLGHLLWDARLGGDRKGKDDYADALAIDANSNIYVTGAMYDSLENYNITTLKYDSTGQLLWQSDYNGTDNDWDEGYGVVVDPSGGIFVGGRSNQSGFSGADFVIIKYDDEGNEMWNVRYSRGGFSWPFKLRMDNRKNLYIGGWSSTSSPATSDFTLVKYSFKTVGVDATEKELEHVLIWPNPNSGHFKIGGDYELPAMIKIFDLNGNLLAEESIFNQTMSFDFTNFTPGVYLLQFQNAHRIFKKKIIFH